MDIAQNVTVRNWDGTWTYRPKVVVTPHTVQDLIAIMRDTARFPSPVRPAGSMHSTARMNGDDGGTLVDMKAMNRILEFGPGTVTVEAGATHMAVAEALKARGLQFYVMTEIGNVTIGAFATAATKDSSFPGEYGQVCSYVTRLRLVTPQGEIKTYSEEDNPEEMRLLRSSYGLFGIVFEVTLRVRPTTALAVRHLSLSLSEFRERFPAFAREFAVMYYLFPFDRRVAVELRKDNPAVQPTSYHRWKYRNRFWRKYGPATTQWIADHLRSRPLRRFADKMNALLLRQALVRVLRSDRTWPHAQIISYPRDPGRTKYIFSMWAFDQSGFFDILEDYCDFCTDYERRTGYRCDLPAVGYAIAQDRSSLLSYSWDFPTLCIDPTSTGGADWERFLRAYNAFCSARGGLPLFNQTPFLTRAEVAKAFGKRLETFAAARRKADPEDRLLDSYFRELLPQPTASEARVALEEQNERA
jgi:FAD/FMN-containing dehydrogenase